MYGMIVAFTVFATMACGHCDRVWYAYLHHHIMPHCHIVYAMHVCCVCIVHLHLDVALCNAYTAAAAATAAIADSFWSFCIPPFHFSIYMWIALSVDTHLSLLPFFHTALSIRNPFTNCYCVSRIAKMDKRVATEHCCIVLRQQQPTTQQLMTLRWRQLMHFNCWLLCKNELNGLPTICAPRV